MSQNIVRIVTNSSLKPYFIHNFATKFHSPGSLFPKRTVKVFLILLFRHPSVVSSFGKKSSSKNWECSVEHFEAVILSRESN